MNEGSDMKEERLKIETKRSHPEDNISKKKDEISRVEKKDNSMVNIEIPTDDTKSHSLATQCKAIVIFL